MINLTKMATAAALLVVTSTSLALAEPPNPNQPPPTTPPGPTTPSAPNGAPGGPHGVATLDCRVNGLDFIIMNFGTGNVDSGRQVEWSSPTTGDSHVIMLPHMLAPGDELRLTDVLSDVALRGAPCSAGFV